MRKNLLLIAFVLFATGVFSQTETRQLNWDVNKTDGEMVINGLEDASEPWSNMEATEVKQWIADKIPTSPSDFDGGTLKLTWNDDGLYMFAVGVDDVRYPFPTGEDVRTNWWLYDCINFFIVRGGDPQYGDSIRTKDGVFTTGTYNCAINVFSTDSVGDDNKCEGQWAYFDWFGKGMEVAWQEKSDGYVAEIFVPWSVLRLDGSFEEIKPAAEGQEYGFEFRFVDNDPPGLENDYKYGTFWNNDSGDDAVWDFINSFGKITLKGISGVSEKYADVAVTTYPNPVNNVLNVSAKNMNTLSIMNLVGQQVLVMNDVNDQVSVDVSNMNPGIYFVVITNNKGEKGTQKIIIK